MLRRIRSLLSAQSGAELARFGLVGAGGVVVNTAALFLLHGVARLPLVLASVLAVETAIVNNFVWNDRWTFAGRDGTRNRFLKFNLLSLGGLAINTGVLALVVTYTGTHYLLANLIAIGSATGWNFASNARWTWRPRGDEIAVPATISGRIETDDLVIVPTYDEAENLETLVRRIFAAGPFGILVVDDGSPDGTGDVADRLAAAHPGRIAAAHRVAKDGLGSAYRFGFETALGSRARRIYQMDADLSHDPVVLPEMRDLLTAGADVVIGSRYVEGGGVEGWPLWRRALSRGGSIYSGAILGLTQRDLTGGYKGWSREALESIRVGETRSNGYAFQVETTYRAKLAGAEIEEVPITFADRELGRSKMGWPIVIEAIRVVPFLRVSRPRVRRVPARLVTSPIDRA